MKSKMLNPAQEKNLRGTLIALLLIAGITALGAGYSFMSDPTGNDIGIPLWYIRHSGFSSYFVPGLILFVAIGILGIVALFTIVVRWKHYPWLLLIYGSILIGWIAVQMVLVRDFNLLHLLCLIIGIALIHSSAILQSQPYLT